MTDEVNEFGSGEFGGQFSSSLSANFNTLITDVLRAAGVLTTDPKYRERALTFATYVQLQALKGRDWTFQNRELFFDMVAPYEAGTVKMVQGSRTVIEEPDTDAIAEIQWNVNNVGGKFCPTGRNQESYRVLKVNTSTDLELSGEYAGADTTTPISYRILTDRYLLDVKVASLSSLIVSGLGEIKPIGLQKFRQMEAGNPCLTGTPEYYTVTNYEEDSGQMTVEVYPSPEKRYSARLEYKERITTPEDSDTCFPTIPPEHMDVLFYGTLARIYEYQNNAAMAQAAAKNYQESWRRFASDQKLTDPMARLQHGRHYFHRYRNRRYPGFFGINWFGKVED